MPYDKVVSTPVLMIEAEEDAIGSTTVKISLGNHVIGSYPGGTRYPERAVTFVERRIAEGLREFFDDKIGGW